MTMYLAAPALVAIVGCVLVSEKSDLWGLVVDSANAMAHTEESARSMEAQAPRESGISRPFACHLELVGCSRYSNQIELR